MRMAPAQSRTDASASRNDERPPAMSAFIRRPKIQAPMNSTSRRRFPATVVSGPRGGPSRTIETSARVSSGSVATIARGPAVGLTPTPRGAGRGTAGPPPNARVITSTTVAGSVSPTTITVMLLGTYQRR